jgi:hypothetical protein
VTPPNVIFVPAPAAGGADDTFTASSLVWSSGNTWYTSFETGVWSSTGTSTGTYALIDASSVVDNRRIRLEAGSADVQIGDYCDVSLNGGDVKRCTYSGNTAGNGDHFFEWDDGTFTDVEIQPSGTFGWNVSNLVIEYYRP